jgi:Uma2 family endonuclease
MTTALKLGSADHGRPITYEEFATAEWERGFRYELVDGELYVTPQPDPPQNVVETWLFLKLAFFSSLQPTVLNFVSSKARVFVPNQPGATSLEPDVACYNDFPLDLPLGDIRWQDVSPVLVAEVLSPNDPDKDLVRNVPLYLAVPTIREYWILDNRANPDEPILYVHRRRGGRWQNVIRVAFGETFTTRLLPGFSLVIDPRR